MVKITRDKLNKFLEKYKSDKLTLDLGCKDAPYRNLFPNRIGLDIESGEGVDVVGDAHKLPFEDNKFETIVCTEVLEHLHSPLTAIKEMKRVLKPDGLLILTTRFIFPIHDAPNDYYRFTKYGLEYLFKDWEIIELCEETNSVTGVGVLFERLLLQTESSHRVFKTTWLFLRWILPKLRYFVKNEYGDIDRKSRENNIITSGYYLVCKNKKLIQTKHMDNTISLNKDYKDFFLLSELDTLTEEQVKKRLRQPAFWIDNIKLRTWMKEIPKDSKILDIGCGGGWLAKLLLDEGYININLVDIDNYIIIPEVKELARFDLVNLNFEKLPLDDYSLDIIFSTGTFEHMENPWHFSRECSRVLKKGGKLIFTIPHSYNLYSRWLFFKSCEIERFTLNNNHVNVLTKACFAKCFFENFSLKKLDYSMPYLKFLKFKRPLPNTNFFKKYFSANICYILEKK